MPDSSKGDNERTKCLRYSLLFRTLAKETTAISGDVSKAYSNNAAAITNNVIKKHVNLVCGDSYASRLDSEKSISRKLPVVGPSHGPTSCVC